MYILNLERQWNKHHFECILKHVLGCTQRLSFVETSLPFENTHAVQTVWSLNLQEFACYKVLHSLGDFSAFLQAMGWGWLLQVSGVPHPMQDWCCVVFWPQCAAGAETLRPCAAKTCGRPVALSSTAARLLPKITPGTKPIGLPLSARTSLSVEALAWILGHGLQRWHCPLQGRMPFRGKILSGEMNGVWGGQGTL